MEKILIVVGAAAGVFLVLLILQWFLAPRSRMKAKRLYTPQDLLVSIRIETIMELFSLFSPFKFLASDGRKRTKDAKLLRYLKRETKRRRRRQYRILLRMSCDEVKRYDRLNDEEVRAISRRAGVKEEEVRDLVTEFCLRLDGFLQRMQGHIPRC
ncbi:MAG: hypothetical protein N2234_03375 [Planctomycetota bacterium]|nr:hypothetical protein [Planctomycetota bacterium]